MDILLDLFRDGFRLGDLESLIDVNFFNFFFFFFCSSSSSPWRPPFWFCKTDGDNFSHIWLEPKSTPNSSSLSSILFPLTEFKFSDMNLAAFLLLCFVLLCFCFFFSERKKENDFGGKKGFCRLCFGR